MSSVKARLVFDLRLVELVAVGVLHLLDEVGVGPLALCRERGVAGRLVDDVDLVATRAERDLGGGLVATSGRRAAGLSGMPAACASVRDPLGTGLAGEPVVDGVHRELEGLGQVGLAERRVALVVVDLWCRRSPAGCAVKRGAERRALLEGGGQRVGLHRRAGLDALAVGGPVEATRVAPAVVGDRPCRCPARPRPAPTPGRPCCFCTGIRLLDGRDGVRLRLLADGRADEQPTGTDPGLVEAVARSAPPRPCQRCS